MTSPTMRSLGTEHRDRLMHFATEVSFPEGTRIFEEGQSADHFWIVRTGTVTLDFCVPGRPRRSSSPSAMVNSSAGPGCSAPMCGSWEQRR